MDLDDQRNNLNLNLHQMKWTTIHLIKVRLLVRQIVGDANLRWFPKNFPTPLLMEMVGDRDMKRGIVPP